MEEDDRITRLIEYGLIIAFFAFVLVVLLLVVELGSTHTQPRGAPHATARH
jgi:Flp pilus assembly pilin Flp